MIKIICDKCKHEFSIFEKNCPNCGDKVKISSKFFCNDCGNEIDIYEKKCKQCNKIPEQIIIKTKNGKEVITDFETSEEITIGDEEEYSKIDNSIIENKKEIVKEQPNTKEKKYSKDILLLGVVALIDTMFRLFYLIKYGNIILGFIAVVTSALLIGARSNKKESGILGIITGVLMFITGSIFGNVIGILLLIDSIRLLITKEKN